MVQPVAEFVHDGLRLVGFSMAGEETYLVAPELNLGFDFGRAPRPVLTVDHIFLSHGHMDHAAGAAYYLSQRMFLEAPPGNIWAPEPLVQPLEQLMRLWGTIDGRLPQGVITAAIPGEDIRLRRDLVVRPFPVHHPGRGRGRTLVHALGYCVIEVRKKLLDEYRELTGPQLVELKRQGVPITRRVEIPLICYSGDTGVGDFLTLDYVRNAKIFVLECTFVTPEQRDRARNSNHLHLDDLRRIVPRLNNERIVLTHLTRRTPLHEAKSLLRSALGEDAEQRVTFLMEHTRRARRRRPPQRSPESGAPDSGSAGNSTGGGPPGSGPSSGSPASGGPASGSPAGDSGRSTDRSPGEAAP